jgi:hypothetical protein
MAFRRFLKRHDALLTVIGAILAATTYLVKEVKVVDAQRYSDQIGQAQSVFAIRSDLRNANETLDSVESVARATSASLFKTTDASSRHSKLSSDAWDELQLRQSLAVYKESASSIDAITALANSIKIKTDIGEKLSSLRRELSLLLTLNDDLAKLESNIRIGVSKKDNADPLVQQVRADLAAVEAEDEKRHMPFQIAIADVWTQVLSLGVEQEQESDANASFWENLSLGLFLVSAALALAGKLFGVNSTPEKPGA